MDMPILATKLYIPQSRSNVVLRPRLLEQLNVGLHRKLMLISAPAGFGKTTLMSAWIVASERRFAWFSLDEGDNDTKRFFVYFISALRTILPKFGEGLLALLQSPQIPTTELILTTLVNEITTIQDDFSLVLDDYHLVDNTVIDDALTFLLDNLPPQMNLVIITREDPQLPLARLRARGQLTELRAIDLRFTQAEVSSFLSDVMGLSLSVDNVLALEKRTEGWIAGLQLAAISMQGHQNLNNFIETFTGSHHFILDYLLEEVLQQQPQNIQDFLLYTSMLDRMCGSLCEAIFTDAPISGQETLEYIERANLFIIPLDNERGWYRYHHLFADLLRQRLNQNDVDIAELHNRASLWFEEHGLEIEAFQHAVATNNIERALYLINGQGMPLYYRGMASPILNWLETLPTPILDSKPELWVILATVLSIAGKNTLVEDKLKAAESALEGIPIDDKIRDLFGQIAAMRAILAAPQYEIENIISQSQQALELLHPDNLAVRAVVTCTLGLAYYYRGERVAAKKTQIEAITISETTNNFFINVLAKTCLAVLQESDTELHLAEENYRQVIELFGESPPPIACEAYFGLARILYERNELDLAQKYGNKSIELAQQIETVDGVAATEIFFAHLNLMQGDLQAAEILLEKAQQSIRKHNFMQLIPKLLAVQVQCLIQQGNLTAAANLAESHKIPISQARVKLALGDPSDALDILNSARYEAEVKGWHDERLGAMLLQSIAHYKNQDIDNALQVLSDVLNLTMASGFIRTFLDEGQVMAQLLTEANRRGLLPNYTANLLSAFETEFRKDNDSYSLSSKQPLIEPLSERELEVLRLIADGLSNREISERLFLALDTVKGHNRRIYGKLQVQRRTEAVARARELGLI